MLEKAGSTTEAQAEKDIAADLGLLEAMLNRIVDRFDGATVTVTITLKKAA
jgi:hypothetical protein